MTPPGHTPPRLVRRRLRARSILGGKLWTTEWANARFGYLLAFAPGPARALEEEALAALGKLDPETHRPIKARLDAWHAARLTNAERGLPSS